MNWVFPTSGQITGTSILALILTSILSINEYSGLTEHLGLTERLGLTGLIRIGASLLSMEEKEAEAVVSLELCLIFTL